MLTLGGKPLQLPILQGGMGVGVSLGGLAGAVAACGGMGCISTADAGYREPDFARDPAAANHRALTAEIQKAKAISGGMGVVAINAMVATRAKGLDRTADFVVIEGCKAGGHLGFAEEDLLADRCQTLDEILPGVLAEVKPYEEQYGHAIPVFVAGGVYTGADMAHFTKLGAAGVQLATRFIPTYECDASQTYKDVLLAAKPEEVRIIHSPVGMPGRALNTPLVQALAEGKRFPPKHCARCLKTCDPAAVPYCITHALIEAVKGNVEEGLFFCGENVGRLDRMRTVRELMDELVTEWRQNL